jgi:hypothetical protein
MNAASYTTKERLKGLHYQEVSDGRGSSERRDVILGGASAELKRELSDEGFLKFVGRGVSAKGLLGDQERRCSRGRSREKSRLSIIAKSCLRARHSREDGPFAVANVCSAETCLGHLDRRSAVDLRYKFGVKSWPRLDGDPATD